MAQTTLSGQVKSIKSPNSFIIVTEEKVDYEITLADTEPSTDKGKVQEAIDYLKAKILNQTVYVTVASGSGKKIAGSVLYGCKQLPGIDYSKTDLPCSEGYVLDIEMIKLNFLKYTGKNEALKSLAR